MSSQPTGTLQLGTLQSLPKVASLHLTCGRLTTDSASADASTVNCSLQNNPAKRHKLFSNLQVACCGCPTGKAPESCPATSTHQEALPKSVGRSILPVASRRGRHEMTCSCTHVTAVAKPTCCACLEASPRGFLMLC